MSNSLLNKNIMVCVCGGGKPLSDNNSKSKLLTHLQALRAIAFISIVICHSRILNNSLDCLGAWGVSLFFVLSGFVMVYSYYDKNRIKNVSLISNVKFAFFKLKRIWLLHILCTSVMLVICLLGSHAEALWRVIVKFLLNTVWIQEWFPIRGRSPDIISWFICTIFFSYFIFPWVVSKFEKNYSVRKAQYYLVICLFLQFVVAFIGTKLSSTFVQNGDSFIDPNLSSWFVYNFPLSRLLDVFIGFNLGYIFVNKKELFTPNLSTMVEILGIVLAVIANYYYSTKSPRLYWYNISGVYDPKNSITFAFIFSFSSILLIYSFAMQNGFISKLVTNKISLYLAKISIYALFIHVVIFWNVIWVYNHIPGFEKYEFFFTYGCWISLTLGFVITIVATEIWMRLYAKFIAPKKVN